MQELSGEKLKLEWLLEDWARERNVMQVDSKYLEFRVGSLQPCFSTEIITKKKYHLNRSSRIHFITTWEVNHELSAVKAAVRHVKSHLRERTRWKAHVQGIIYYLLVFGEGAFYPWKLIYALRKIQFLFSETTNSYSFVCSSSHSTHDFDTAAIPYQMEHNAPSIIITQNEQILASHCGLGENTKQHVIKYSACVLTALCRELHTLLERTPSVKSVCLP